jgi:hypothetical protein
VLEHDCRTTDVGTQRLEHSITWGGMRRGGRVKSQFRKSGRILAARKNRRKNEGKEKL